MKSYTLVWLVMCVTGLTFSAFAAIYDSLLLSYWSGWLIGFAFVFAGPSPVKPLREFIEKSYRKE